MDTKYGDKYTVNIDLDNKALAVLESVGWRGKLKEDEVGAKFAKFSRNDVQNFGEKSEKMGPPLLTEEDGKTPFTKLIGNGSILRLKLEIYESKKYGVGSRINHVSVLKHVPYEQKEEQAELPT
jgi:hypothetical protein